jgi:hypothetical protein
LAPSEGAIPWRNSIPGLEKHLWPYEIVDALSGSDAYNRFVRGHQRNTDGDPVVLSGLYGVGS